jgi:hypothetical protein
MLQIDCQMDALLDLTSQLQLSHHYLTTRLVQHAFTCHHPCVIAVAHLVEVGDGWHTDSLFDVALAASNAPPDLRDH